MRCIWGLDAGPQLQCPSEATTPSGFCPLHDGGGLGSLNATLSSLQVDTRTLREGPALPPFRLLRVQLVQAHNQWLVDKRAEEDGRVAKLQVSHPRPLGCCRGCIYLLGHSHRPAHTQAKAIRPYSAAELSVPLQEQQRRAEQDSRKWAVKLADAEVKLTAREHEVTRLAADLEGKEAHVKQLVKGGLCSLYLSPCLSLCLPPSLPPSPYST